MLRSIPAHAGEPEASGRLLGVYPVYPRPRGGTPIGPSLAGRWPEEEHTVAVCPVTSNSLGQ